VRIRFSLLSAAVVVVALFTAAPAFAQDEVRGDFSVGYSVMRDSDLSATFPAGFLFAITGDVNKNIRIIGEFGGNYKVMDVPGARVRLGVTTYQGGIRFLPVGDTTIRPFVQFLAGGARLTGTVLGVFGANDAASGLAIQPGGGVEWRLSRLLDARTQVDYRSVRSNGETTGEYRVAFSVAIPFGRR
jgi:hypothetical protein